MVPASASTAASRGSAATRCRCRCGRVGPAPTTSTGTCCRSTPTRRTAISPSRSASDGRTLMSWFAADIDGPLVLTRGVHFVASAAVAGALTFRSVVARPTLQTSAEGYAGVQAQLIRLAWVGLAVAVASGIVWLTLETMILAGIPFGEAMRSGAMLIVVDETQFGLLSEIRGGLAILLAACLALDRFAFA